MSASHYLRKPEGPEEKQTQSCFKFVENWDDDWKECPLCGAKPDNFDIMIHNGPLEAKYRGLLI